MVLIYANQLFTDWGSYPKCLTFEYAEEDAKYTLLLTGNRHFAPSQLAISAQLYGPVAAVMPVAPSTNINSRAAGFNMALNNGAL